MDAFVDTLGDGHVDLAIELDVPPDRITAIALADLRDAVREVVRRHTLGTIVLVPETLTEEGNHGYTTHD